MKTVGILTMHKVVNYGSALQAWATQIIIEKLGYSTYIIDYIYPNEFHLNQIKKNYIKIFFQFILHLFQGFPYKRKQSSFQTFWKNEYKLSKTFESRDSIVSDPPLYDMYVLGSDQVWNLIHMKGDRTFFLNFVPNGKKKISFSSSLAQDNCENYETYKSEFLLFDSISVREENGAKLLKKLLGKDVHVCLDPTLVLDASDYDSLSVKSELNIEGPYILVYILQYAFNPYPYVTDFIKYIHKETKLKVVCLDFSAKQYLGIDDMVHLRDSVGPYDFLKLIKDASLVVTTSFHGTAFALNFGVPFFSIVNNESSGDDRMTSLLTKCEAKEHIIVKGSSFPSNIMPEVSPVSRLKLVELRTQSIDYLLKSLS